MVPFRLLYLICYAITYMAGIRWRYVVLVFFGIWTAFLPVLGFPRGFKNLLYVCTGLLIVVFAYYAYVGALSYLVALSRLQNIGKDEHDSEGTTTVEVR